MEREHEAMDRDQSGLSADELAAEQGRDLPEREAMSVIHLFPPDFGNIAMPINQSVAENYNTNDSIADSSADQIVIADQGAGVSQPSV
jgi:hypothetical protein